MNDAKGSVIDSPIGKREVDSAGSPAGTCRMDVNRSYAGVGELLQDYRNNSSQESRDAIETKIDYTHENLSVSQIPDVEVTSDPSLILTARFEGGKEIWP